MARVIVDAGPLIAFAKVNQTDLFQRLFGGIDITVSVQRECMAKPCGDRKALSGVMQEDWLHVCVPAAHEQALSLSLGDGERDSIYLALEYPSDSLLIMDDFLARKQIIRLGLPVMGTVRMLYIAQHRNLISSAEMVISDMREHGYRISTAILEKIQREQVYHHE